MVKEGRTEEKIKPGRGRRGWSGGGKPFDVRAQGVERKRSKEGEVGMSGEERETTQEHLRVPVLFVVSIKLDRTRSTLQVHEL
jgi:hypothetical protein